MPSINVLCVEDSNQLKSLSTREPYSLQKKKKKKKAQCNSSVEKHTIVDLLLHTLSSAHVAMILCCPISFQSTLVTAKE